MSTAYHAKYFAHELTKRCPSGSVEKLAGALSEAQVDLNPHQIEAALFAFSSPLSKGAILADEVGLGKTIEAGILVAQKWAERKRRLLVICPANLRKQWSQELADKFFLPSAILETRTFNDEIKKGNLNPFRQEVVVIASYQFARSKEPYLKQGEWDLVVIDEAHRLRNVYKNTSKIARAIKDAVAPFHKVLLTATPLQNSLLELYGLVSIVDDYTFGDQNSFKDQYARLTGKDNFEELKKRLRPVCKRTLRKQVLEYIKFTNRHALVQEFLPTDEEQRLYDLVSEYLQRPNLYALPARQRKLMTLILRKLLASSTFAISATLQGLADRLLSAAIEAETPTDVTDAAAEDFEEFGEIEEEWAEDDEDSEEESNEGESVRRLTPEEIAEMKKEAATLQEFHALAKSIVRNSKGAVLLTALKSGFRAAADAQKNEGAATLNQKAIIFTESRRTQEYLFQLLGQTEFAGNVVLFNGSNSDPKSREIYQRWAEKHAGTDYITGSPTADKRAALVEHFRDEAAIMIATEAAAEGINLQFCNLVVNYDLPWNPQRIEQRIGRCHRYGQNFDVVVVNFLNKKNAADQRVYQLLDEKFKLFNGVFGASDEVLGAIESGVDFEKRIAAIYQKCRTSEQIEQEFDELQQELEDQIVAKEGEARELLLNNFDQEVIEKVKIKSESYRDRYQTWLWRITRYFLADHARFHADDSSFILERNPFDGEQIHPGPYRLGKRVDDANTYRVGHPLAQRVLGCCKELATPSVELLFSLDEHGPRIAILEPLRGMAGWLVAQRLTLTALEEEDHIVLAGEFDDGPAVTAEQCRRLFDVPASVGKPVAIDDSVGQRLNEQLAAQHREIAEQLAGHNAKLFDAEMDKLDRWADDLKRTVEVELRELQSEIRAKKKLARHAQTLQTKLDHQKAAKELEKKLKEKRKLRDETEDSIEAKKDKLLEDIEAQLGQRTQCAQLFAVRWRLA